MQEKSGLGHSLYQWLASLKLTIFIFLVLAAASLLGTLLPQGMSQPEIHSQYSPTVASLIDLFGLSDLYHTGWFQLLLLILCINLIVCSLERLPKILKIIQHREEHINPQKLLKFSISREITSRIAWEDAKSRLAKAVADEFTPVRTIAPVGDEYASVAEKGRWSPLTVYIVHLSVLLILIGALMGSTFGFKGSMNIPEGDTSGEVILTRGDKVLELPFQVRCDDFSVSYYDTGMPKEFRSDLGIIENGKEVLKRTIRVNDPLTYKGVTFYQSSYGNTLKEAVVDLTDKDSGKTYRLTLPYREVKPIPDTGDRVQVVEYQQDLAGFGPALGIVLLKEGQQESSGSWVLVKRSEFHGNRIQNYQVKVISVADAQYTGLQVKKDPGIWIVYLGFTIMLVGIGLAFYMSHRRIWIWASPGDKGVRVILAGRTNKNSLAFEHEFDRLCKRLEADLKTDTGKRKPGKS